MIKSMKPMEGKVAVVLPQGVLFHSGKEGDIREQLIKSDLIEAVVALAGGVFMAQVFRLVSYSLTIIRDLNTKVRFV